ncbi:MAG TPA: restriction endonuclease [Steroidobacteraceae bacterium]|jgi:restriction system protein
MLSPKATEQLLALTNLSRQELEQRVSAAYRRLGFQLPASLAASGGAEDGVLMTHGKQRVLLQCKHCKARKITEVAVRELFGMMAAQEAEAGILITCGSITLEASRFAGFGRIQLLDGAKLLALLSLQSVKIDTAEPAARGKSSAR